MHIHQTHIYIIINLRPSECATLLEMECVSDGKSEAVMTRVGTMVRESASTRVNAVATGCPGANANVLVSTYSQA